MSSSPNSYKSNQGNNCNENKSKFYFLIVFKLFPQLIPPTGKNQVGGTAAKKKTNSVFESPVSQMLNIKTPKIAKESRELAENQAKIQAKNQSLLTTGKKKTS